MAQMRCRVLEKGSNEPVIGATIMVEGGKAIIAVTDQDGFFCLSDGFTKIVRIS